MNGFARWTLATTQSCTPGLIVCLKSYRGLGCGHEKDRSGSESHGFDNLRKSAPAHDQMSVESQNWPITVGDVGNEALGIIGYCESGQAPALR